MLGFILKAGSALLGAKMQSNSAKSAAKKAAKGAQAELEFNRESRDLVRADQAPYREAGTTALNALMSLTGLGGPQGAAAPPQRRWDPAEDGLRPEDPKLRMMRENQGRGSAYALAYGGDMQRGNTYNINELGPEDVYSGGSIRRHSQPATIEGHSGYVHPTGRAMGGMINRTEPAKGFHGLPPGQGGAIGTFPDAQNTANSTAIDPSTGYPNENPGGVEGGYQFQTDPGYQFRFSEGQRALDRGAAARGGLLSGGYARKAIRYGQGFASNEYTNVYNRIANIAGLGQTANQASGSATMQGGAMMGNAASNAANASAWGQQASGNAWAGAANQIAQLPWDEAFKKKPTSPTY